MTTNTQSSQAGQAPAANRPGPWQPRAIGVAAAGVAAALIWIIANAAGADMSVVQGDADPTDVTAAMSIGFAVLAAAAGWGLLALLERFTARGLRTWTIVALVVLLVSFMPLFGIEADGGTTAALALMHLAVGAAVIPLFRRGGAGQGAGSNTKTKTLTN
ncbi:DUF6069 family protein [Streptomyces harbinensis]|uniref:DUF6069 family protein n=1 Tax=Streptomyces harbinensis TaxID=1176198 RepID=UPI0033986E68